MGGIVEQKPSHSDEELIEFWREIDLSMGEIAVREGIELSWLKRQWERLRREGMLPRGQRTLHWAKPMRVSDGGDFRAIAHGEDPLLPVLYRVHKAPIGSAGYDPALEHGKK